MNNIQIDEHTLRQAISAMKEATKFIQHGAVKTKLQIWAETLEEYIPSSDDLHKGSAWDSASDVL